MDDSEQIAHDYLKHVGFEDLVFEPEGYKTSPDFLVAGTIAVEVRRLNQNWKSAKPGEKREGLETMRISIFSRMKTLLSSLGLPTESGSWFVLVRFKRPVPEWRKIEAEVREKLTQFRQGQPLASTAVRLSDDFSILLVPTSRPNPFCFVLSGGTDGDSGGWVIPELERNLRLCIEEKTEKMSSIRGKYQKWWLVLIDHINYGSEEVLQIPPHDWDKIILVSPLDHTQAFEVRQLRALDPPVCPT